MSTSPSTQDTNPPSQLPTNKCSPPFHLRMGKSAEDHEQLEFYATDNLDGPPVRVRNLADFDDNDFADILPPEERREWEAKMRKERGKIFFGACVYDLVPRLEVLAALVVGVVAGRFLREL